jgi:hypothetical protein
MCGSGTPGALDEAPPMNALLFIQGLCEPFVFSSGPYPFSLSPDNLVGQSWSSFTSVLLCLDTAAGTGPPLELIHRVETFRPTSWHRAWLILRWVINGEDEAPLCIPYILYSAETWWDVKPNQTFWLWPANNRLSTYSSVLREMSIDQPLYHSHWHQRCKFV